MARLGRTIAALHAYRKQWDRLFGDVADGRLVGDPRGAPTSPLREITDFGPNPGRLRMHAHVPPGAGPGAALVVVLHGCTQTAATYDRGAGWSNLARRHGFALLFPEQRRLNNPKTCFHWFRPGHVARDRGEAASIRHMVEAMVTHHALDRRRVFVTGLSAGGAMAAAMLATYPEVFAGGAVIAGLPYGAAASVQQAFEAMFRGTSRPARAWGERVRAASPHRGPWPRLSVWHGTDDRTVVPSNAEELIKQWTDLHGLPEAHGREETVDGHRRRVWRGPSGDAVECFTIAGLGHGTPIDPTDGESEPAAGPFFLDAGVSSTWHIARFFGLTGWSARLGRRGPLRTAPAAPSPGGDVADEPNPIVRALRSAGLIRKS